MVDDQDAEMRRTGTVRDLSPLAAIAGSLAGFGVCFLVWTGLAAYAEPEGLD